MNASPAPEDSHEHCDHDHSHGQGIFFTIETIALVVWGAVLTYYVASGKVTPFLTTTGIFREQALVGGLLLFVVAVFNFAMRNRFPGCGHDHGDGGHEHHHDEGTAMSKAISLAILTVPVVLAACFAPADWTDEFLRVQANSQVATNAPAASSALVNQVKEENKSTPAGFTLEDFKKYAPPTPEGHFRLSVSDLWSIAGDPDVRKVLAGQVVETTAQVVNDTMSKAGGNRLRVFELQMTCCAADARPVSFPIEFSGPVPEFREMGWYQVTGTIDFLDERGGKITVIKVTDMAPTTKPKPGGRAI